MLFNMTNTCESNAFNTTFYNNSKLVIEIAYRFTIYHQFSPFGMINCTKQYVIVVLYKQNKLNFKNGTLVVINHYDESIETVAIYEI